MYRILFGNMYKKLVLVVVFVKGDLAVIGKGREGD